MENELPEHNGCNDMRNALIILALMPAFHGVTTAQACDGENGNPEFTGDGAWILFTSTRDGNSEVYRMRPDGSEVSNLTNHPAEDLHPVAMPGNRGILFDSDRDGSRQLYRMDTASGEIVRLTGCEG